MHLRGSLSIESGIIIFNIISGTLAKKARLEVALDDGYWPCFSTAKSGSRHAEWKHVGEGFLKEIDFSRVWLRLNEAEEGERDDIIAEWKGDTKSFLQDTLVRFTSDEHNSLVHCVSRMDLARLPLWTTKTKAPRPLRLKHAMFRCQSHSNPGRRSTVLAPFSYASSSNMGIRPRGASR